jgi:hypothetical protein
MKISKKYVGIVKIKNNPDGSAYCIKYRFDDLLKFTNFLDQKWQDWKWFNVFSNKNEDKGIKLASFTKNNKPKTKSL